MSSAGDHFLIIDADKCTGCRLCELACSMKHFGICSPHRSRIKILEIIKSDYFVPVVCQSCEEAPCIKVCPMNARVRDKNESVVTDEERCIGCRACVYICPFGTPVINPDTNKTLTCDRCGDDESGPWCVVACRDEKALQTVNSNDTIARNSREKAKQMKAAFKPVTTGKK